MRILIDSCVWGKVAQSLRSAGHDVVAVRDWPADPGDDEILQNAVSQGRIVVTLDKDFGELVFLLGRAHTGIVRLVGIPAHQQADVLLEVLAKYGTELEAAALVTAHSDRIRIRLPR